MAPAVGTGLLAMLVCLYENGEMMKTKYSNVPGACDMPIPATILPIFWKFCKSVRTRAGIYEGEQDRGDDLEELHYDLIISIVSPRKDFLS